MRTAQTVHRVVNPLELEALDPLPCGCVTAIFRIGQRGARVMSVEAKGPYCLYAQHSAGRLVDSEDSEDPDGAYG
jgi:hypothetical protein